MSYKIYIGASTPHRQGFYSRAIKWYSKKNYNHIYVRYYDSFTQDNLVAESSNGEHHKMTYENWIIENKTIIEYEITVSIDIMILMVRHINKLLQTPYGYINAIGVPIYDYYEKTKTLWVRKMLEKLYKKFRDGENSVICSESASFLLMLVGIEFNRPYDFIRPDHVIDKLASLCETRIDIKKVDI